jgi:hypothetical protein
MTQDDATTPLAFAQKGTSFGFRLGMTLGPAFIAADYETGNKDMIWDGTGTQPDLTSKTSNTAIALGIDVPVMPIRAYVKYIFSATNEIDYTPIPIFGATLGAVEYKGTGFAVGLGLTFLPIVDINIEYKSLTFDEGNGDTLGTNFENTGISIGISAPFSL